MKKFKTAPLLKADLVITGRVIFILFDIDVTISRIEMITTVLTRIFHTDRDEEAAKADGVRQASILMQGCMCTYCPNQNVSLTQHPSDFPASVVDQYEISRLARLLSIHSRALSKLRRSK